MLYAETNLGNPAILLIFLTALACYDAQLLLAPQLTAAWSTANHGWTYATTGI